MEKIFLTKTCRKTTFAKHTSILDVCEPAPPYPTWVGTRVLCIFKAHLSMQQRTSDTQYIVVNWASSNYGETNCSQKRTKLSLHTRLVATNAVGHGCKHQHALWPMEGRGHLILWKPRYVKAQETPTAQDTLPPGEKGQVIWADAKSTAAHPNSSHLCADEKSKIWTGKQLSSSVLLHRLMHLEAHTSKMEALAVDCWFKN